jgi:hypothetical protein
MRKPPASSNASPRVPGSTFCDLPTGRLQPRDRNADAHLKNFSLLERGGELRLSPAYDLINTERL